MGLAGRRHCAVEDRRRRAAAHTIAVMRPVEVVELPEAVGAAVEAGAAGEVVAPKDDPPMLAEDRLLESLDEAIGPGMARLDARLADAERPTGGREVGFELIAAIRQDALHRPARAPRGRHQDVAQEARGRRGRERWQDPGDAIRARRVARRNLPDLAHALEMPDVEGVQTEQLGWLRCLDMARAPMPEAPQRQTSALRQQAG